MLHYLPYYFSKLMLSRSCNFYMSLQVMHLEDYEEGSIFSNLSHGPYPLVIALSLLALDSMLYLLLALYLDQVIPGMIGFSIHGRMC